MFSKLNDRQLDVLSWIGEGCSDGRWPASDFTYKTSATALQRRGLVSVSGRGRTWSAEMTDAGVYYREHGNYPPEHRANRQSVATGVSARASEPPPIGDKAAQTLDEAKKLIDSLRLNGSIELQDPLSSTRARYRRLLHACREHHLVPPGLELRFTGRDAGDIVIALVDGSEKAESDWLRIRTTARRITTNVEAIRNALAKQPQVLRVSEDLRPRAIEFAVALANELPAHELRLGVNAKLKTPKLFLQVGDRRRDVHVFEGRKDAPHVRTVAEEREARRNPWRSFPTVDRVPNGVLHVTVVRDGWDGAGQHEKGEWVDKPKLPIEKQVRAIAREIKAGIVDDHDAAARQAQARAEQLEEFDRKRAEERLIWEQIRAKAYDKAQEQLRESVFTEIYRSWVEASELRRLCDELQASASAERDEVGPSTAAWIAWARSRADAIDPTVDIDGIEGTSFDIEPGEDDLRPFMDGWSPTAPQQDYGQTSRPEPAPSELDQAPWHPGLRGRPTWWR